VGLLESLIAEPSIIVRVIAGTPLRRSVAYGLKGVLGLLVA
jgi:hypothetical protein